MYMQEYELNDFEFERFDLDLVRTSLRSAVTCFMTCSAAAVTFNRLQTSELSGRKR